MGGVAVSVNDQIPLTPAPLPQGEGTAGGSFGCSGRWLGRHRDGFCRKPAQDSPSPRGRGTGWGKGDARCANGVGTSPEVCWSPEGPYGFEPFIL